MHNLFTRVLTAIFILACVIFSDCVVSHAEDIHEPTKLRAEYFDRGCSYGSQEDYEKAIECFTKAIEIDPNYFRSYQVRGHCYNELKNYDLALKDFNKAVELASKPNDKYDAYLERWKFYFQQEKFDLSIQDLNKAIETNPDTIVSIAYVDRGKCYLAIGENEKALQDFNKAIEIISFDGRAYYYRGLCYQKLGDEGKAHADFARAKELYYEEWKNLSWDWNRRDLDLSVNFFACELV